MGRAPCCSKVGLHKGSWSIQEDKLLADYIQANGEGQWRSMPKKAGLLRCGKSCRLRWMNYLRPGIKRGNITADEEDLIIRLQSLLGNRWSLIAGRLPGRTDNEIKNHWNTHLLKRLNKEGIEPKKTHKSISSFKETKNKKMKKKKKTADDHSSDRHKEELMSNNNITITKSNSFASLITSGNSNSSSSSNQEEAVVVDHEDAKPQVSDISWSSFELDDNQILLDDEDCYLSLQALAPTAENYIMDNLYDEYLQLPLDHRLAF